MNQSSIHRREVHIAELVDELEQQARTLARDRKVVKVPGPAATLSADPDLFSLWLPDTEKQRAGISLFRPFVTDD